MIHRRVEADQVLRVPPVDDGPGRRVRFVMCIGRARADSPGVKSDSDAINNRTLLARNDMTANPNRSVAGQPLLV